MFLESDIIDIEYKKILEFEYNTIDRCMHYLLEIPF